MKFIFEAVAEHLRAAIPGLRTNFGPDKEPSFAPMPTTDGPPTAFIEPHEWTVGDSGNTAALNILVFDPSSTDISRQIELAHRVFGAIRRKWREATSGRFRMDFSDLGRPKVSLRVYLNGALVVKSGRGEPPTGLERIALAVGAPAGASEDEIVTKIEANAAASRKEHGAVHASLKRLWEGVHRALFPSPWGRLNELPDRLTEARVDDLVGEVERLVKRQPFPAELATKLAAVKESIEDLRHLSGAPPSMVDEITVGGMPVAEWAAKEIARYAPRIQRDDPAASEDAVRAVEALSYADLHPALLKAWPTMTEMQRASIRDITGVDPSPDPNADNIKRLAALLHAREDMPMSFLIKKIEEGIATCSMLSEENGARIKLQHAVELLLFPEGKVWLMDVDELTAEVHRRRAAATAVAPLAEQVVALQASVDALRQAQSGTVTLTGTISIDGEPIAEWLARQTAKEKTDPEAAIQRMEAAMGDARAIGAPKPAS